MSPVQEHCVDTIIVIVNTHSEFIYNVTSLRALRWHCHSHRNVFEIIVKFAKSPAQEHCVDTVIVLENVFELLSIVIVNQFTKSPVQEHCVDTAKSQNIFSSKFIYNVTCQRSFSWHCHNSKRMSLKLLPVGMANWLTMSPLSPRAMRFHCHSFETSNNCR